MMRDQCGAWQKPIDTLPTGLVGCHELADFVVDPLPKFNLEFPCNFSAGVDVDPRQCDRSRRDGRDVPFGLHEEFFDRLIAPLAEF